MAKKRTQTEPSTRRKRTGEIRDQYGDVLYASSYELDAMSVNEMAALKGSSTLPQMLNIVSFLCCLLIVFLLWRFAGQAWATGVALVLVIVTVIIMALTTNVEKVMARQIRKNGFDVEAMSEQERVHDVYVLENSVVVDTPGISTREYPLSELYRVRRNADFLLADFRNNRLALIPRKSVSQREFNAIYDHLEEKRPEPAAAKLLFWRR